MQLVLVTNIGGDICYAEKRREKDLIAGLWAPQNVSAPAMPAALASPRKPVQLVSVMSTGDDVCFVKKDQ